MLLAEFISPVELNLLYAMRDRADVNKLLALDGTPVVLRAVIVSLLERLALEKGVNFRPSTGQLRSSPLARVERVEPDGEIVKGEPVSPEFSYPQWLTWFASQRGLQAKVNKPLPRKTVKVAKVKEVQPRSKPAPARGRTPEQVMRGQRGQRLPSMPGYRIIVIDGREYYERL